MKTTFSITTLTFSTCFALSSFFIGNLEARQSTTPQPYQPTSQNKHWTEDERQILERYCTRISSQIAQYFSAMGAMRSSSYQNTVKEEITNYLLSVGTPTAFQLIREYEANNFRDYI